jgi:hypothetical protein
LNEREASGVAELVSILMRLTSRIGQMIKREKLSSLRPWIVRRYITPCSKCETHFS